MQPPKQEEENKPTGKKKGKEKGALKLKDIVFKMIPCLFPQVIDHLLLSNGIDSDIKIDSEEAKEKVLDAGKVCLKFLKAFISSKQKGYLYSKGEDYFEFSPFSNSKLSHHILK